MFVRETSIADAASTVKSMNKDWGNEASPNMDSCNNETLRSVQEGTVFKDRHEWLQPKNWKKKSGKYTFKNIEDLKESKF